ncbi:hypothetical protein K466DRAFT_461825, partial [Polyporus arcularius HHB13444]
NETEQAVSHVLEEVAIVLGAKNLQAGKSSWNVFKVPYVFPVVGGRKVEQLYGNMEALNVALTEEHIKRIESAVPFDPGFPSTMIVRSLSFHL